MQALHLLALAPVGETIADPNSYGFREQRSCADAIEQCYLALRSANTQWVLEGDIKACFDTISKDWLLTHIPMDKAILGKWLTAGYMDKHVLHETTDGTPQGGIISPALAHCALDGLERILKDKYPTGKALKSFGGFCPSVNFIRYADDFVITGRTKELLEGEVKPIVKQFLQERGLELSPTKTVITHVEKGFDFLGQNVRRYPNGKLFTKPSKKNVKTFLAGIRTTIKAALGMSAADLIEELNPKIRGWANYHRHVVSKRTFSHVDKAIFSCLWRWARKRHQNKNLGWIKAKYFAFHRGRNWTFFGETYDEKGTPQKVWLLPASRTPITRHVKVKAEANPYDPRLSNLLRRSRRDPYARFISGYQNSSLSLVRARRTLLRLPRTNHPPHWMESLLLHPPGDGWLKRSYEQRPSSPRVPRQGSSPPSLRS
jgi:RNA-directed DNA polymerase